MCGEDLQLLRTVAVRGITKAAARSPLSIVTESFATPRWMASAFSIITLSVMRRRRADLRHSVPLISVCARLMIGSLRTRIAIHTALK